jgi:glycosyltransferase involved in cell wall biosynthesis
VATSGLATVVTVAFNSARTIGRTIDSIAAQTYPMLEYIVVDGGSTDGTVELLQSRVDAIDRWVSERDAGISDAFNKGIAMANGEYIALVNSDDWLEPTHLSIAIEELNRTGADFVFGDLLLHSLDDQPSHMLVGDRQYARSIRHSMPHVNHPTIVCRRRVYEMRGLYDTTLRSAMDYEWLLRGYQAGVVGCYVPGMVTHMSMAGVSHRDYTRGFREVRDVSIRYGYPSARAGMRYMIRLMKSNARRALSALVPKRIYDWLRRRVNRHYRSIGASISRSHL